MKKIILIIAVTVVSTLILTWGGHEVVVQTGKAPFCGSCHAWDGEIAQTNINDNVHGANNARGIVVKCVDCHLPHSSMVAYLGVKAKNGIAEAYTTLTKDPAEKDWLKDRESARENYTYDSACVRCHENAVNEVKLKETFSASASKMHLKYLEFKDTDNQMKCTSCHKYVGHKNLGNLLFEQKSKVPTTWEEWEKQREELLKTNEKMYR